MDKTGIIYVLYMNCVTLVMDSAARNNMYIQSMTTLPYKVVELEDFEECCQLLDAFAQDYNPEIYTENKIRLVKTYRAISGMGLKDAKEMVELAHDCWRNDKRLFNRIVDNANQSMREMRDAEAKYQQQQKIEGKIIENE